ncbi:MAG: hypothetical protein IKE25_07335 [Clostridia bacterium]|nr:hypothetical protein [Clostridia bacterium]
MKKSILTPAVKRTLCVLLLLLSLVMTVRSAWTVSTTLIDSDTSSELILGEKLSREGGIMSDTWVYSTELQVIDAQIVYALLFKVTGDWSAVRFWGSVIMDLMMLGAFAFLCKQAKIPFNRFCVSGAAMMLPFSIPYGRIILFHNYYSFHISFSFLIVGLYLGALRRAKEWKRWPFWVFSAGLALAAFAACLAGVRDLMISIAPLFVTAVLCALINEGKGEEGAGLKREAPGLLLAAVPVCFGGIGYMVNARILSARYAFQDFSVQSIALGSFADLYKVIYNTFVDLGFQDFQNLFSMEGLLGIGGVTAWIVSLILAFHTIRRSREPSARFMQVFWLMVQFVITCVFVFLSGAELLHMLYLLPIIIWIFPALAAADLREGFGVEKAAESGRGQREKKRPARLLAGDAPVSVHGLVSAAACLLIVINGLFYTGFFRDPSSIRLEYTGLQYNDTGTVKGLQPVADYLKENGFTLIYGSYWDAAVVTELSDGAVRSMPVETGSHKHPIRYMKWLADTRLQNPEWVKTQKTAIVANMDLSYAVQDFEKLGAVEVASFGGYTIYELPEPAALAEDLS